MELIIKWAGWIFGWLFSSIDKNKADRDNFSSVVKALEDFAKTLRTECDQLRSENDDLQKRFESETKSLREAIRIANEDVANCEKARGEMIRVQTTLREENFALQTRVERLEQKISELELEGKL